MLHALLFAIAIGPEQFAGEPAFKPLLVEKRVMTASNGNDIAIVSEGEALTIFRMRTYGEPVKGVRPVTGGMIHDVGGNGRGYAAVWSRGPELGANDIGVTILDAQGNATTVVLERQNRRPAGAAVASDGRNYLVAWDGGAELHCQLLDETGKALRPIEVVRVGRSFGDITMASNGNGFVVAAVIEFMIISIHVSAAGVASGPVEVPTRGGRLHAFEWMRTHYLLITGIVGSGAAQRLDAGGRPFGPWTPLNTEPRNAVRQGDSIVGEWDGRLYRIDAEGRVETINSIVLPPRRFTTVWTLASNGVDLFFVGGDTGTLAQILRLGGGDPAMPIGFVYLDQHSPQAARAAGLHAVAWREGTDWFASRVRGGVNLDGRGVEMRFPPALASDGTRTLMLFAGNVAWPIPHAGPFPMPTGAFAEQPLPTWTGKHFVSISITNLGRQTSCLWDRKTVYATVFAPDGTVVQPRTFLGIDGDIVVHSVVGNGDGFVLAWRYSVLTGCNARYVIQAQSVSPDLTRRTDLFPAKALASDERGTTVFAEEGGVFASGRTQAKAIVGTVHVAWLGTTFVLAKQTSRGIEVARWDPHTQPLALDWESLGPEIATSDATATLTGLASSQTGATLVYTRIASVPGWGEWRRAVIREIDASPSRRRAFGVR